MVTAVVGAGDGVGTTELSAWLMETACRVDEELQRLLDGVEDVRFDPAWEHAFARVRELCLRPGKRVRPALFLLGAELAGAAPQTRPWLRFAAAVELLHVFVLIHDDLVDDAAERRGGPTLHVALGAGGRDLALIAGDFVYTLALSVMLGSELPGAPAAVERYLRTCRRTAIGQFLDVAAAHRPLADLEVLRALRIAQLKTAEYSFVAPLTCGAALAGGDEALLAILSRYGRHLGVAFQVRDDLLGVFGDPGLAGKSVDTDLRDGRRSVPVILGWARSGPEAAAELAGLLALPRRSPVEIERIRVLLAEAGAAEAGQRLVDRATRRALAAADALPLSCGRGRLVEFARSLVRRER